jgi:hypothetical protein
MKKLIFLQWLFVFFTITVNAQFAGSVKGKIIDSESQKFLYNVKIMIKGSDLEKSTDDNGFFIINNIPVGDQIVHISLKGYEPQNFQINISNNHITDLGIIQLYIDLNLSESGGLISLTEDELNDDTGGADNISGLLQSTKDIFLKTAAFEFSPTFFRVRGLDSENGTLLLNGIEMNKVSNGKPQWSDWGGLNDIMRNQQFSNGLSPSEQTFGGILGSTNINLRASSYRGGGRITYSSSNRSYTNRVMASYASGLLKNGWAYTFSVGRRWGDEGYSNATFYDANSFFTSVEKIISKKHSINITAIYTPNKRGKSSPNTDEVFKLKNIKYNEYWGYQNGKKRNSRVKEIEEPIIMINHYWDNNQKTSLNTNIAYQFGHFGNTRLDYNGTDLVNGYPEGGGTNPSPAYYQKLPSYFLRFNPQQTANAFGATQQFMNKGQINWNSLYEANLNNTVLGGNAIYALYEDRNDDTQLTINSILSSEISDNISLNSSVSYRNLKSENFANMVDLLGATGYLDIDSFADDLTNNPDAIQNDIKNPNRLVGVGDRFKYNYILNAKIIEGFVQGQFKFKKTDFFLSGKFTNTNYQREGLYQNGSFKQNSFDKGKVQKFSGFGVKGGLTYKISGRHLLMMNTGYRTKAPSLRNTFTNARENHDVVRNITEEKISSADVSYIYRSPFINARLTGYYLSIKNANEISFFFADGIGGDNSVFVQEILQGIDKIHAGGEFGVEIQVTSDIKIKGVASFGEYVYNNNPNLYLTTEPTLESEKAGFVNGFKNFGKSSLKNYKIPNGPQRAYSIGFEYRDPDYWWFGMTSNYFSNSYIDISPLTRTQNFSTDFDGLPFNDYDEVLARKLLKQEQFEDYFLVNAIGGKSWKVGDYYIGFFASVNNILDKKFKTGGFEQGRNANFRQLRDDKSLDIPVFGSKYWYGRGSTYFVNLYVRF